MPTDDFNDRAKDVKALLLDVDGVLTDGRLYYSEQGEALKVFNTLDGHGIKLLQQSGVAVGIISGRQSGFVERRAAELGIEHVVQGREDKIVALDELCEQQSWRYEELAFLGDDLPDLPVIRRVRLGMAVANAHALVSANAAYVTDAKGGKGAVREVCDLIMRAQGNWETAVAAYL